MLSPLLDQPAVMSKQSKKGGKHLPPHDGGILAGFQKQEAEKKVKETALQAAALN